jgi:PIN domain nuclease of toxin-antitoxin system
VRLLLDTHVFLWFVWNDPQLSSTARALMEDATNELFLSAASAWEMGIKIGTGKLSVGQDLATFLLDQMTRNRIELLPISVGDAGRVAVLPFHHKDPFDRLIVAQSLTGQMPLVSRDEALDGYGITRLW